MNEFHERVARKVSTNELHEIKFEKKSFVEEKKDCKKKFCVKKSFVNKIKVV